MNVDFKDIDEKDTQKSLVMLEHNILQVYISTKAHMDKVENDIRNIEDNEIPDIKDDIEEIKKEQQRIITESNSSGQVWMEALSYTLYGIFGAVLTFFVTKWLT